MLVRGRRVCASGSSQSSNSGVQHVDSLHNAAQSARVSVTCLLRAARPRHTVHVHGPRLRLAFQQRHCHSSSVPAEMADRPCTLHAARPRYARPRPLGYALLCKTHSTSSSFSPGGGFAALSHPAGDPMARKYLFEHHHCRCRALPSCWVCDEIAIRQQTGRFKGVRATTALSRPALAVDSFLGFSQCLRAPVVPVRRGGGSVVLFRPREK